MKKILLFLAVGVALGVGFSADKASAGRRERADRWAQRFARTSSWHRGYSHTNYGQPLALVVPPNVNMSRRMGWGVAQTSMTPIYHQFHRGYPGYGGAGTVVGAGGMNRPTPPWPSHTDQFGVYYIRGPW